MRTEDLLKVLIFTVLFSTLSIEVVLAFIYDKM